MSAIEAQDQLRAVNGGSVNSGSVDSYSYSSMAGVRRRWERVERRGGRTADFPG